MNFEHLIIAIFFGTPALIVLIVLLRKILSKLKGSVHIELPRPYRYQAGEKVSGTVVIKPRSSIVADRIKIGIFCSSRTQGQKGSRTTFHYKNEMIFGERMNLRQGMENRVTFELPLPDEVEVLTLGVPEKSLGETGQKINHFFSVMSTKNLNLKWEIVAEIETAGVDLRGEAPLDVGVPTKARNVFG